MSEETVYKAQEAAVMKSERRSWPALALIGTGTVLLGAFLFDVRLMDYLWPLFVALPGILLLWPARNSTAEHQSSFSFLAVPGAFFLALSALLFITNLTDHFEAWAYSWPLLLAAMAAGWMYMKRFDEQSRVHDRGYRFIRWMAYAFGGLAFFFEILVFENFNPLMSLGLIGLGFYLLLRERRQARTA